VTHDIVLCLQPASSSASANAESDDFENSMQALQVFIYEQEVSLYLVMAFREGCGKAVLDVLIRAAAAALTAWPG